MKIMKIDVVTIFPSIFQGFINESMIRIAQEKKLLQLTIHDLRNWTTDKHRQVDDVPYGGGSGMVMKPEPFYRAVMDIGANNKFSLEDIRNTTRIIVFTPRGRVFNQKIAEELSKEKHIIMLCGRYEGIDERVHQYIANDEISLGDFVLNGGEIPAMAVIEAVTRLIPGALGAQESLAEESFTESLLEYPQYTRPPEFMGWKVPDVLLSGHHGEIAKWRRRERLRLTFIKRPDLLKFAKLDKQDLEFIDKITKEAKHKTNE